MTATEESSRPTVELYVRMAGRRDAEQRVISFWIPNGLDPMDLLERGFAIDGEQAVITAGRDGEDEESPYHAPFAGSWWPSLSAALAAEQKAIVAFLRECGYNPTFA